MTPEARRILDHPHILGKALGYKLLSEVHSEWIRKYWTSHDDIVMQAHRNSYKTTALLVVGSIWYLLFNPEATLLIVRKDYEGAASILSAISKHYGSPMMAEIYRIFGYKTALTRTEDNKDRLTLSFKVGVTKEGSIESTGIGGSITGSHYDKICCDDIATIKDRISKAEREKTKSFVRELANVKKATGNIIVSGTPWHKDDVYSILPKADRYPYGSIDIPELTPQMIAVIKERTTPSLFAINYQLKYITDENKIFSEAKFAPFSVEASGIIAHIDCAYSGSHHTALTIIELWGGRFIVRGWVWRENIVDLYTKIAGILKLNNVGSCYLEDNADKGLARKALSVYHTAVSGYHEAENKHNKIIGHLRYHWANVYFATDCQDEYVSQVLDYEEGQEPDDAPDSLACALRIMGKRMVSVEKSIETRDYQEEYKY